LIHGLGKVRPASLCTSFDFNIFIIAWFEEGHNFGQYEFGERSRPM
jgi:hypothetical protein